jgi:2-alkyl-3-oxoalkanoate reductase
MRILVTGATGFLGGNVVTALRDRGHVVRAVHRPGNVQAVPPDVELVALDLRSTDGLVSALHDVDVVVHAAAITRGSWQEQVAGTVSTTENVLAAMGEAGVDRLVLVSSFAVYAGESDRVATSLDESSPTADPSTARDAYCATKLRQEELVRAAAAAGGWSTTVARPGVIFGPGRIWTPRLGYRRGQRLWVCVGRRARLPLTYVANCADALAVLAESTRPGVTTVNVVDDQPPTQAEFRCSLRRRGVRPRYLIVLPWPLVHAGSWLLTRLDRLLGGPFRLPGALRLETVRARWRPNEYPNAALRQVVPTQPVPLAEALDAAVGRSTSGAR